MGQNDFAPTSLGWVGRPEFRSTDTIVGNRSISVGDVAVVQRGSDTAEEVAYICMPVGWQKLTDVQQYVFFSPTLEDTRVDSTAVVGAMQAALAILPDLMDKLDGAREIDGESTDRDEVTYVCDRLLVALEAIDELHPGLDDALKNLPSSEA